MSETSRPEAAFVLLLMQATFWLLAGVSALPFVLGGEPYMLLLAAFSMALAALGVWSGVGLVRRRGWARRTVLVVEWICLAGTLLQLALPIGANRGPVSLLVNLVLPAALILLLRGRSMRARFGTGSRRAA
ncbi:MAG TPA: hypothetical protein VFL29_09040 [Candidatus Dormibacteraeota bacterium]|nr:hypothetical protein [Candidatus Dormibacteraeota bacterium]